MGFQLTLGLKISSKTTLRTFFPGVLNEAFVNRLTEQLRNGTPFVHAIHGGLQTGKSHLLKGACHELASRGLQAGYIDLRHVQSLEILKGLEQLKLIAFDHIDAIAHSETALNELRAFVESSATMGRQILIAGRFIPTPLQNLKEMDYYNIQRLIDEDFHEFLKIKAEERGLSVPEDICVLILEKSGQEPAVILEHLDRIEERCDLERKKLSLRFARMILNQSEAIST